MTVLARVKSSGKVVQIIDSVDRKHVTTGGTYSPAELTGYKFIPKK